MISRTATWVLSVGLSAILVLAGGTGPAEAVVIRGEAARSAVPPPDNPGWENVGMLGSASLVYLGDGWVLTAAHAWGKGQSSVWLDGARYPVQPGSVHRLQQPDGGSPIDLTMFRIADPPPELPNLTISAKPPPGGAKVLGIGAGRTRSDEDFWWDQAWRPASPGTSEAYHGYAYTTERERRWGVNHVLPGDVLANSGYGETYMLRTTFDQQAEPVEMQAATGDSGGALFYKNGDQWELAGVILAVSPARPGQPSQTVVFGDSTYYADLSRYRGQIQQIMSDPSASQVPEPSSIALLAGCAVIAVGWHARHRLRSLRRRRAR